MFTKTGQTQKLHKFLNDEIDEVCSEKSKKLPKSQKNL